MGGWGGACWSYRRLMAWQDALRFLCKEPASRGDGKTQTCQVLRGAPFLYFFFLCVFCRTRKQMFVCIQSTGRGEAGSRCLYGCQGSGLYRRCMFAAAEPPPPPPPPSAPFCLTTDPPSSFFFLTNSSICWIIYSFGRLTTRSEAQEGDGAFSGRTNGRSLHLSANKNKC